MKAEAMRVVCCETLANAFSQGGCELTGEILQEIFDYLEIPTDRLETAAEKYALDSVNGAVS